MTSKKKPASGKPSPAKITYEQIEELRTRGEWRGFGYLGHENRRHATDVVLASVATLMSLSIDEVFLWANSRPARHFMDEWGFDAGAQPTIFAHALANQLREELPRLRNERTVAKCESCGAEFTRYAVEMARSTLGPKGATTCNCGGHLDMGGAQ
jgi:hypothetical protein